jgi:hypothetical protein
MLTEVGHGRVKGEKISFFIRKMEHQCKYFLCESVIGENTVSHGNDYREDFF